MLFDTMSQTIWILVHAYLNITGSGVRPPLIMADVERADKSTQCYNGGESIKALTAVQNYCPMGQIEFFQYIA